VTLNNGKRVIAKHKRTEWSERAHVPKVNDPARMAVMTEAAAIAEEWAVPMRLEHILQDLPHATGMEHTGEVVRAMVADIYKEAKGEIIESKEVSAAIGRVAAKLWKQRVSSLPKTE
jgi:hypothetical protein